MNEYLINRIVGKIYNQEEIIKKVGGLKQELFESAEEYGERAFRAIGNKATLILWDVGNGNYTIVTEERPLKKTSTIDEWNGQCPKCGNCNNEQIDYQHDVQESIQWLECSDCEHKFSIASTWYLRDEENRKKVEEDTKKRHEVGNFLIGDFWGDVRCKHGHEVKIINVFKDLYAICDTCKTYTYLGYGLCSTWQFENEEIWNSNRKVIEAYQEV